MLLSGMNTTILATTSAGKTRVYAKICNDSATKMYLSLNNDIAIASTTAGFPVAGNTCYDINDQNLYQGAVHASAQSGSQLISVNSWEL